MKIVDKYEPLMKIVDKYEPLMKIAYKHEALIKLAHQGMINQYKEYTSKLYRKFEKKIGFSMRYKDEDGKFYFLIYNFLWDLYKKSPKNFDCNLNKNLCKNKGKLLFGWLGIIDEKLTKSPRLRIIKVAFEQHLKSNYFASIPLMITQFEGIVWDIAIKNNLVKDKFNSQEFSDNSSDNSKAEIKAIMKKLKSEKIIGRNFNVLVNFYGNPNERNSVIHGRNIYKDEEYFISLERSLNLIIGLLYLSFLYVPDDR